MACARCATPLPPSAPTAATTYPSGWPGCELRGMARGPVGVPARARLQRRWAAMRRLRGRRVADRQRASLLVATVATNALGLVFWIVAAHLETPRSVGRAAAVVAALTLLATISAAQSDQRVRPAPARPPAGSARRVGTRLLAVIALTWPLGGRVRHERPRGTASSRVGLWARRAVHARRHRCWRLSRCRTRCSRRCD